MTTIWMQRYEGWLSAGYDNWESLRYCFIGPAHFAWYDDIARHRAAVEREPWAGDTYPWKEV
jgi:hypothetical protein